MLLTSTTTELVNLGIGPAAVLALLGYAVVFLGIVFLMVVVIILGKCFMASQNKTKKTEQPQTIAEPVAASPVSAPVAPGTAGQLKLYDVPPKTAAMIMAIVADKMGKPLNELRFISIKEVKE